MGLASKATRSQTEFCRSGSFKTFRLTTNHAPPTFGGIARTRIHRKIGGMKNLLALALVALCAACGGGDPEPSLSDGFTVTAVGGRADIASSSVQVDLPGPTITLDAPASVYVEIELDWQQSQTAPSGMTYSVVVAGVSSVPQTIPAAFGAAATNKTTHGVWVSLPAGATKISAVGIVSTDAETLTYVNLTATWRVSV